MLFADLALIMEQLSRRLGRGKILPRRTSTDMILFSLAYWKGKHLSTQSQVSFNILQGDIGRDGRGSCSSLGSPPVGKALGHPRGQCN